MGTRRTRTPISVSPLDTVTQLMTERAKYEQWLEDLEAKKDSTPTKVFDRVRQDYLSRLQTVMDQLKQHASALQEHASNLSERLEQLEQLEEEQAEKRAEAELRANVGEMSESEWDTLSKKADREIAKFKQDQELVSADIKRIRDLLGGLTGDSGAPPAPKKPADVDEMEFLKSVVGATPPAGMPSPSALSGAARPAASSAAPQPAASSAAAQPSAPVAAQPPAAVAAQPPAPAAAAQPPATRPSNQLEVVKSAEIGKPAEAPAAKTETPPSVPVTDESPSALRTSGVVEQPKTLKCTECGAMNYPSEWYCERCGAELTVV